MKVTRKLKLLSLTSVYQVLWNVTKFVVTLGMVIYKVA
jgi:hypothetical protein